MQSGTGERASPEHLVVGHVAKPHGTKGELFVWPLTDTPDRIFAPGRSLLLANENGDLDDAPQPLTVAAARPFKRGLLVSFEGFERREHADHIARRYLLVPAEAVPPRDEGEVFYHELLGIRVETVGGEEVGRVREVFEAVPNDLLEVRSDDGRLRLIPFAERIVTEIDLDAGRLVVDPPEGLLDL